MYESNTQAVSEKLIAASSEVFTQETIDTILSLVATTTNPTIVVETVPVVNNQVVTPPPGTEVVFLTTSDTEVTKVTVNANTPAIFFQGNGGVDATIGSPPPSASGGQSAAMADADAIQRVVVGTAGADKITIVDGKNTQIIAGDKDVIKAGSGHTVVVAAQGSSTVIGGAETIVEVKGDDDDFTISFANGQTTILNTKTSVSVNLSGVDYVQLDNNEALIFADNAKQAVVANLYQAVLGRTAEYGGLDFWFEMADKGVSVKAIAQGFINSAEYQSSAMSTMNNTQFIATLYQELLGRSGDTMGTSYWVDALASGVSRADVFAAFAESSVTNSDELTVVGTVTILPPGSV